MRVRACVPQDCSSKQRYLNKSTQQIPPCSSQIGYDFSPFLVYKTHFIWPPVTQSTALLPMHVAYTPHVSRTVTPSALQTKPSDGLQVSHKLLRDSWWRQSRPEHVWSTANKLTVSQLVAFFPLIHLPATLLHTDTVYSKSTPSHPISLRRILILSSYSRLGLPSGFPTTTLCIHSPPPIPSTCPANLILHSVIFSILLLRPHSQQQLPYSVDCSPHNTTWLDFIMEINCFLWGRKWICNTLRSVLFLSSHQVAMHWLATCLERFYSLARAHKLLLH